MPFIKDSTLTVGRTKRRRRRRADSLHRLLPLSLGPYMHTARLKLQQQLEEGEYLPQKEEGEGQHADVAAVVR